MSQVKLLKFIDGIIGPSGVSLVRLIKKHRGRRPSRFKKILLIRPGGIGDAVLLFPAINALKTAFPDSDIDLLCEKRNAGIFELSERINRLYLYDKGLDLIKCLRSSYDVVIDTEQWHRLSAIVAYLTGAAVRIGFDTNERGRLFTHRIPYSHDDYEVYSFLHLIEPLIESSKFKVQGSGLLFDLDEPFLNIEDDPSIDFQSSTSYLQSPTVAIFPGASVVERRWGGDRFGKVAKALNDKGYRVVMLGSNVDRKDAERIKKYASNSFDLTGRTSLEDVARVLKMSKLLITADSGLMHIAYAVGTPTVSLFGSGIEKKWAPRGKKHIVINKHIDCSPCTRFGYTPRCKRGVECLSSISVAEVIASVERILDRDQRAE